MFNSLLFIVATIHEKIISRFEFLRFLRGWLLCTLRWFNINLSLQKRHVIFKLSVNHNISTIQMITAAVLTFLFIWNIVPAYGGLSITVAYDNSPYQKGVMTDNGFSCYIKAGRKNILFDTGGDSAILSSNMKKLGINLQTIDSIVISHRHLDHTGGLLSVVGILPKATVFLPETIPEMQQQLQMLKIKNIIVNMPKKIGKGLFLTGKMNKRVGVGIDRSAWEREVGEQALIISAPPGMIIVAGCSHPGIIDVISRSKQLLHRPVYLVIGGFHSLPQTIVGMSEVVEKFRAMGVRKVGPAHCTPEKVKAFFKTAYGVNYITMGAGKTLNFSFKKK